MTHFSHKKKNARYNYTEQISANEADALAQIAVDKLGKYSKWATREKKILKHNEKWNRGQPAITLIKREKKDE